MNSLPRYSSASSAWPFQPGTVTRQQALCQLHLRQSTQTTLLVQYYCRQSTAPSSESFASDESQRLETTSTKRIDVSADCVQVQSSAHHVGRHRQVVTWTTCNTMRACAIPADADLNPNLQSVEPSKALCARDAYQNKTAGAPTATAGTLMQLQATDWTSKRISSNVQLVHVRKAIPVKFAPAGWDTSRPSGRPSQPGSWQDSWCWRLETR